MKRVKNWTKLFKSSTTSIFLTLCFLVMTQQRWLSCYEKMSESIIYNVRNCVVSGDVVKGLCRITPHSVQKIGNGANFLTPYKKSLNRQPLNGILSSSCTTRYLACASATTYYIFHLF